MDLWLFLKPTLFVSAGLPNIGIFKVVKLWNCTITYKLQEMLMDCHILKH